MICRVLPYALADGPHNMAADEVMLTAAVDGRLSLRFYGWNPPTVSLGYFQPSSFRRGDPNLAALPFVRRPSGGLTLVHHHELTYALALPPALAACSCPPWLVRVHQVIAGVLLGLGAPVVLHTASSGNPATTSPLCFHHLTPGDVVLAGSKVVGSAQRKARGALLHHGGILLARSPFTPTLPGIRDLAGLAPDPVSLARDVAAGLAAVQGWKLADTLWQSEELHAIDAAVRDKYARTEWNDRR